ncbi:hypothetical protein CDL12_09803 [Handroanthus impetiginosus]|uniref:Uncharacterized protein n=1 Tax=Handroanthus impetiginosus TaxID=429701 RepID=A0A2G9HJ40_9LAMI|nr:hypothetical protein CDL12_09803 [Handroanthus impetiginosus]
MNLLRWSNLLSRFTELCNEGHGTKELLLVHFTIIFLATYTNVLCFSMAAYTYVHIFSKFPSQKGLLFNFSSLFSDTLLITSFVILPVLGFLGGFIKVRKNNYKLVLSSCARTRKEAKVTLVES